MSPITDGIHEILRKIAKLDEPKFRNLLGNFFTDRISLSFIPHGSLERGSDILLWRKPDEDIMGSGQYFYFQVKVKEITAEIWRRSLHSQLMELYDRPHVSAIPMSDDIPCRIFLVTNWDLTIDVTEKVKLFNTRHYLPIEILNGRMIATLLNRHGCTLKDIRAYVRSPFPQKTRKLIT